MSEVNENQLLDKSQELEKEGLSLEGARKAFNQIDLGNTICEQSKETLKIARVTEKFLQGIYKKMGKEMTFPIDIQSVASKLGFEISVKEKERDAFRQFNKVLSKIYVSETVKIIEVDNDISYKTQQYAIAHSIARYLLWGEEKNAFEKSFAIPLMPSDLDELTTDKVALFLLLPLDLFKKEFKSYLSEQKDGKLNVDDWLQALSDRSQVNLFNLAIGYQQLKMAAYQERWEEFECYMDAMKSGEAVDFKDEYEEIFA